LSGKFLNVSRFLEKKDVEMRNIPTDKYNVAWFKLAECVSRGEKERALGVYRLLSHSFEDAAFAAQLQGDIFLAFDDKKGAAEQYAHAARLYISTNRLLQAAAIYEHLLTLDPGESSHYTTLIELYVQNDMPLRLVPHLQSLALMYLNKGLLEQAVALFDAHNDRDVSSAVLVRKQLVFALLDNDFIAPALVIPQVIKTIDELRLQNPESIEQFLADLERVNSVIAARALAYNAQN
jgi:tetratricopeptide (TPR) repeat protein